jgi:predicted  nucleic acid-binding Zn-ribbon protein
MNEFCSKSEGIVKDIKSASPKEVMLISRYFRKESDALTARIKSAEEQLRGFREYLDSGGKMLGVSESLEKLLNKNREFEGNREVLNKKIRGIEKKRQDLKKGRKTLERELEEFLSSGKWKSFQVSRDGLKKKREGLLGVENQIMNELSVVMRPFRKLNYEFGEELPGIQKKSLGEYLENPMGALLSDQGIEKLGGLLESLLELLRSGRLSLKDRERGKVESLLKRIDPDLSALRDRHIELKNGIRDEAGVEKKSGLVAEKESLQEKVDANVKESEELGVELGYSQKEKEALEESIGKNKREIESLILENTGKRLSLK